jgi:hypothetical protein
MSRYKGRSSSKTIERDFPHHVETGIPLNGLGDRLNAIYAFHAERGIQARHGRGRRDAEGRDYVTWCFADAATADEFRAQFGGGPHQR